MLVYTILRGGRAWALSMARPLVISLLGRVCILVVLLWSTLAHTMATPRLDSLMRSHGLVDVQSLDARILVDLRYAGRDNFLGRELYQGLSRAYLEASFARRVARAQAELSRRRPGYRLLIYDAARPMSVQRMMYAHVEGTPQRIYVAPAGRGGRHNYGVAVDLTIVDDKGLVLDMGTAYDHFGEEAHLGREADLVAQGRIDPSVIPNRALLRAVMATAGLRPYAKEWWHYQERISMSEVRRRYRRLDF